MTAGALAAVAAALLLAGPARAIGPDATLLGDSVAGGIAITPPARAVLEHGVRVRLDVAVCRRLVQTSCTYRGRTPTTILEEIHHYGSRLGPTVVISVGYNASAARYARDLATTVGALRRAHVERVVWLTLSERDDDYRQMNRIIRRTARSTRILGVLDWAAAVRAHPGYVADDQIHLTPRGATAMARLIRSALARSPGAGVD